LGGQFRQSLDGARGRGRGENREAGKLPLNLQLQAFYNVERPDNGPDWQLRFQILFLFPK
jgi:hypothetical protein